MVSPRHFVVAVVGPTASGKSDLAEHLAKQLDGEIVSADSMQVYRGLDIGTAKMPPAKRGVPYHCVDIVAPDEEFNASAFQKAARAAIADIGSRGKQPIICGGTGLYVRAALDDFELGEDEDSASLRGARLERRARLEAQAAEMGPEAFHAQLASLDAPSAALIHPNNVRRVVRAFEWLEEGSSYAQQAAGFDDFAGVYPTVILGLDLPREQLYARINERVVQMIEQGLLNEVRTLLEQGYGQALTAQQAIGYKELLGVLSGDKTLEVAVAQIQQATRHYAKRQLSWFRRDQRIIWLDAQQQPAELTSQALVYIRAARENFS